MLKFACCLVFVFAPQLLLAEERIFASVRFPAALPGSSQMNVFDRAIQEITSGYHQSLDMTDREQRFFLSRMIGVVISAGGTVTFKDNSVIDPTQPLACPHEEVVPEEILFINPLKTDQDIAIAIGERGSMEFFDVFHGDTVTGLRVPMPFSLDDYCGGNQTCLNEGGGLNPRHIQQFNDNRFAGSGSCLGSKIDNNPELIKALSDLMQREIEHDKAVAKTVFDLRKYVTSKDDDFEWADYNEKPLEDRPEIVNPVDSELGRAVDTVGNNLKHLGEALEGIAEDLKLKGGDVNWRPQRTREKDPITGRYNGHVSTSINLVFTFD